MPRDISVNNYCSNIIEDFQYKSVDHVLAMLQEGDYIAVVGCPHFPRPQEVSWYKMGNKWGNGIHRGLQTVFCLVPRAKLF